MLLVFVAIQLIISVSPLNRKRGLDFSKCENKAIKHSGAFMILF